jgi:hypothetical protein
MDFEDLIPIAVLVFWVVAALARRKGGKKRMPPPLPRREKVRPPEVTSPRPRRERPPGRGLLESLREGLEDFAKETREEVEQDFPTSLKPRAAGRVGESRRRKPGPKPRDEVGLGDLMSPSSTRTVRSHTSVPTVLAETGRAGRPSTEELRKAIVWSEILGPPVSLRDE